MSIDNKVLYIKYFIIVTPDFGDKPIGKRLRNLNIRRVVSLVFIQIFKSLFVPIYEINRNNYHIEQ